MKWRLYTTTSGTKYHRDGLWAFEKKPEIYPLKDARKTLFSMLGLQAAQIGQG